ncbi:MAG: DNA topoisomerase VI, partial [Zestosphaera sp.]
MSSSTHLTSKDLSARSKALEVLRSKFNEVIEEVMNGRTPTLVIRKRTLTNTIYDEVNGLLKLGEGVLKRSFLNVNESKKFMQTLLMASIIYESLKNNEYPTIRDLYYRGKHTIKYRDLVTRKIKEENTWDEQKESDSVIRDLEVFIDMLREDMLILSKEKGKVVGNMRIRS